MGYKEIHLTDALPDEDVDAMKGGRLTESHYDRVIGGESTKVLKPDGSPLLHLIKGAIPQSVAKDALPFIVECKKTITNRGTAAGVQSGEHKYQTITRGGWKTNTTWVVDKDARAAGSSATVGYYDRYPRFPYCRICRNTERDPAGWQKLVKICKIVDGLFRKHIPARYANQRMMVDATDPAWVIGKTAFTTVTVNQNFATACHKDAGDFAKGFGCMAYLETGKVKGGMIVIPKYRIAVNLSSLDVLLFDVHEWHGNTALAHSKKQGNRITLVFYFREKMVCCGTPEHEASRVKYCRTKGTLYDPDEMAKHTAIMEKVKKL